MMLFTFTQINMARSRSSSTSHSTIITEQAVSEFYDNPELIVSQRVRVIREIDSAGIEEKLLKRLQILTQSNLFRVIPGLLAVRFEFLQPFLLQNIQSNAFSLNQGEIFRIFSRFGTVLEIISFPSNTLRESFECFVRMQRMVQVYKAWRCLNNLLLMGGKIRVHVGFVKESLKQRLIIERRDASNEKMKPVGYQNSLKVMGRKVEAFQYGYQLKLSYDELQSDILFRNMYKIQTLSSIIQPIIGVFQCIFPIHSRILTDISLSQIQSQFNRFVEENEASISYSSVKRSCILTLESAHLDSFLKAKQLLQKSLLSLYKQHYTNFPPDEELYLLAPHFTEQTRKLIREQLLFEWNSSYRAWQDALSAIALRERGCIKHIVVYHEYFDTARSLPAKVIPSNELDGEQSFEAILFGVQHNMLMKRNLPQPLYSDINGQIEYGSSGSTR